MAVRGFRVALSESPVRTPKTAKKQTEVSLIKDERAVQNMQKRCDT